MKKLRDGGMVTKHASGRDGHSFGNNYPVFTTHGRPVRNCRQAFGPSRKLRGACTLRGSDKYLPFSGAGTDNSVLALQHHAMPPPAAWPSGHSHDIETSPGLSLNALSTTESQLPLSKLLCSGRFNGARLVAVSVVVVFWFISIHRSNRFPVISSVSLLYLGD